jgi:hypothetical protein
MEEVNPRKIGEHTNEHNVNAGFFESLEFVAFAIITGEADVNRENTDGINQGK